MTYKKCPKCGRLMKQIPIKRLDSTIIIEFYCDRCDESLTFYPNLGVFKADRVSFF